jgi:hypothetical protein
MELDVEHSELFFKFEDPVNVWIIKYFSVYLWRDFSRYHKVWVESV